MNIFPKNSQLLAILLLLYPVGPNPSGNPQPSVSPHTPYNVPHPTDTPRKPGVPRFGPDICEGHFDTIAILRGEMFIFKVFKIICVLIYNE